jgi:L-fucose isomerase-like protein
MFKEPIDMNVKPVFILSRGAGVFVDHKGRIETVKEDAANQDRINSLLEELKTELGGRVKILEGLFVSQPADLDSIFASKDKIDLLLVYFLGVAPIEALLRWEGPIIAFSGQFTPAFSLYAVAEERHLRKNLFIALDYKEIRRILNVLKAKKALAQTKIVLIGNPGPWHLRWYGFPDLEAIRRKVGTLFTPVELRELIEQVEDVDLEKAASLAEEWINGAEKVKEPSMDDLKKSAAVCLAIENILKRKGANAMAINCLRITLSAKLSGRIANPCMGMSYLQDKGIPCGCEMDIAGLLTKLVMSNLSEKPTFLGNIVRAEPESNLIKISHCILPTRMQGFDKEPLHYTLRDYHGRGGVTAFTEVPLGVEVTLARAHRNLKRIVAVKGEIIACDDTTTCRNTLTIKVRNAREFIRRAEGNHHALVFGDYLEDLEVLGELIGFQVNEV